VGIANGGTGLTATPTNGQLLIGNGTGFTLATLTAGSGNLTITNSAGGITIDAPFSGACSSCAAQDLHNVTGPTSIPVSLLTSGAANIDLGSASGSFRNLNLNGSLFLKENTAGTTYFQLTGTPTTGRTVTFDDLSGKALLAQQTTTPTAQNGTVSVTNTQTGGGALAVANSNSSNAAAALTTSTASTAAAFSATSTDTTSGTTASLSGSQTTGTIEQITGNSLTTGTALNITANALTTGSGLSVNSTSSTLTSANLLSVSHTATYTTPLGDAGNLINAARVISSNISGNTISVDQAKSGGGGSKTLTNVSVGNFTGRVLLVSVYQTGCSSATTGASYGAQAMTLVGSTSANTPCGVFLDMYKLANPAVGTANVTITGGCTACVSAITAVSMYGVDTSGSPWGNSGLNASASSGAAASVTLASAAGQVIVAMGSPSSATIGGSETAITGVTGAQGSTAPGAVSVTVTRTTFSAYSQVAALALNAATTPSVAVTGAVAALSSNCTTPGSSSCNDSSNILNLNQQYASATGAVFAIQNAGAGPDVKLGNGIIRPTSDSTNAVKIQNAAGSSTAFMVDTTNSRVRIGSATVPGYPLDVTGDINTTGVYRVNGTQISSANLSNDSSLLKSGVTNSWSTATTFSSTGTTDNGLNIQGTQTTGTTLALTANSITTGSALSVSSTQVFASTVTQSGNVANVSRANSVGGTITQDGATVKNNGGFGSISINVTDHGDNNRLLLVTSQCGRSPVWNGAQSFTQLSGTGASICLYYLKNPTVGNFSITGVDNTGGYAVFASSWYNVDQTNPIDTGTSNSSSTITPSPTSVGDEVFDYLWSGSGVSGPGAGQTGTTQANFFASATYGFSFKAGSAGSTSMTWSSAPSPTHIAAVMHPASGALTISGAVASISSSCTISAGSCTDSGSVLNLNQQYASATGAVLNLQNAGSGAAVSLTQTGSSTIDIQLAQGNIQTAAGTTSTGVKLQSGAASAGSSGTAQLLTGGGTTGTGAITIQTGTSTNSGGTSGSITIDAGGTNAGTSGTISVGTTNANAVSIGRTGKTTTINGALTVTQAATFSSTLSVTGDATFSAHLISAGSTPSVTSTNANAGTGNSGCAITGNEIAGKITITAGTGTATGQWCVFGTTTFGAAPHIVISGNDVNSAKVDPYAKATSATAFEVGVGSTPVDSTAYSFEYFIIK
jgi:hypothetical protein